MINKQCFASVGTKKYENCDENEYKANLKCRSIEFNKKRKMPRMCSNLQNLHKNSNNMYLV